MKLSQLIFSKIINFIFSYIDWWKNIDNWTGEKE